MKMWSAIRTKVQLRGPEWDEHDPDHHDVGRPPSSPWENIEKLCRNISLLPSLQEVVIDPSYNSSDSQQLDSNYVVWLLSPRSKFSTLRIGNLDVCTNLMLISLQKHFVIAPRSNLCASHFILEAV